MNRLLEGDVGSGKTVVSAIAMFLSFLNGFQSVLMAPTEILAQQHYTTISKLLKPFRIKLDLPQEVKRQKLKIFDIMIGTHAVLEKGINFEKLGLVVIDEQQRFGVEQRALIRSKGKNPHITHNDCHSNSQNHCFNFVWRLRLIRFWMRCLSAGSQLNLVSSSREKGKRLCLD